MTDIEPELSYDQFEKEIHAICRGIFKSVYKSVLQDYIIHYPHFEFLSQLPIEQLQYLNRDIGHISYWTKDQHIFWFLSQCIENMRIQIIEPTQENQYIRFMMHNDARYYQDIALEKLDRDMLDKKYHRERDLLVEEFSPLLSKYEQPKK